MSGARFLIGDVRARMSELPDSSADLILTSPPFLALRTYLPDGDPHKGREIGSEATPAEFLTVLLDLTAEWGRLLAPHGSLAVELGDTYAGSDLSGWPLDKSLCILPALYAACLAYGFNVLTGEASRAGQWRVRNVKPWIRSNPPVGALGDKERPATSYIIVATRARGRYFDLDAVRTAAVPAHRRTAHDVDQTDRTGKSADRGGNWASLAEQAESTGAPPRDWWHHVDAVLDAELEARAADKHKSNGIMKVGKASAAENRPSGGDRGNPDKPRSTGARTSGARGMHLRRALERAGILATVDALDISPKGYKGAHYAVWPPELVRQLIDEMTPRRVCTVCGQPSRRITGETSYVDRSGALHEPQVWASGTGAGRGAHSDKPGTRLIAARPTLGWSDCECPGDNRWRPGLVLDPFAGSGTTLEVATGMGRDAIGIDIDARNADLAFERVGMFLEIEQ